MSEEKSFWKTLPGIITGIAAIITAITGLVVALNGTGLFKKPAQTGKTETEIKKEPERQESDSTNGPNKVAEPETTVKKYAAKFTMNEIKTETHEYKFLDVSVEPIRPATNSLKIKIRYTNNSNYSQANFWNEGFRISNDTLKIAPVGDLNELVDRHASLVGTVAFEIPNDVKNLILHIYDEGGKDFTVPLKIDEK
jgi:hypothetical protein